MAKAIWNGVVVAESDRCEIVEGNHYFPPDSVRRECLSDSDRHTTCPWNGEASYYHVEVDGQRNADAAWVYPKTLEAAKNIEGFVAFWKGVIVEG